MNDRSFSTRYTSGYYDRSEPVGARWCWSVGNEHGRLITEGRAATKAAAKTAALSAMEDWLLPQLITGLTNSEPGTSRDHLVRAIREIAGPDATWVDDIVSALDAAS